MGDFSFANEVVETFYPKRHRCPQSQRPSHPQSHFPAQSRRNVTENVATLVGNLREATVLELDFSPEIWEAETWEPEISEVEILELEVLELGIST